MEKKKEGKLRREKKRSEHGKQMRREGRIIDDEKRIYLKCIV